MRLWFKNSIYGFLIGGGTGLSYGCLFSLGITKNNKKIDIIEYSTLIGSGIGTGLAGFCVNPLYTYITIVSISIPYYLTKKNNVNK